MQGLDRIKTEADGSFMIPPRQFLGHREQDSFDKPIKHIHLQRLYLGQSRASAGAQSYQP